MSSEEIVFAFKEYKNDVNAAKMAAYMKNKFVFLGIKSPIRREIQKEFLKETKKFQLVDTVALVKDLFSQEYRELHYFALDILKQKKKAFTREHQSFAKSLVLNNSWWDTVDFLATHLYNPILQDMELKERKVAVNQLVEHNNLWLNRVAIIYQLPLKEETNTNILESAILTHIDSKEFFHQKAIGWSLRQYSKTNPSYVAAFIEKYKLSKLAKKEASKYL